MSKERVGGGRGRACRAEATSRGRAGTRKGSRKNPPPQAGPLSEHTLCGLPLRACGAWGLSEAPAAPRDLGGRQPAGRGAERKARPRLTCQLGAHSPFPSSACGPVPADLSHLTSSQPSPGTRASSAPMHWRALLGLLSPSEASPDRTVHPAALSPHAAVPDSLSHEMQTLTSSWFITQLPQQTRALGTRGLIDSLKPQDPAHQKSHRYPLPAKSPALTCEPPVLIRACLGAPGRTQLCGGTAGALVSLLKSLMARNRAQ